MHHAGGEAASWAACARGLWAASGSRGRGGREAGGGGGTDGGDERQEAEGEGSDGDGAGRQASEGSEGGSGAKRQEADAPRDGGSGIDVADVLGSSEHLRGRGAAGPGLLVALQIRRGLPLLLVPPERGE